MPGHFTHVYTARRLAEWLGEQETFTPLDRGRGGLPLLGGLQGLTPRRCHDVMTTWEVFTNIGAIGPDLFFFSQDYASGPLAAEPYQDDVLMLAMAAYYWVDTAKDEEWEPLLLLLAEVDTTFARIVRVLIRLKKIVDDLVAAWDATIGPVVSAVDSVLDDVTGGLVTAFGDAVDELVTALKELAEQELVTFADVFSWFSLKLRGGWDEQSFLWSDVLHYRRTTQMARNLFLEAQRQFDEDGDETKLEQFQAFALGWVAHLGTDTIDHSFVNEQCGGPFRTHWQRHHLVENHIDAWNYRQAGEGGSLPPHPLAATATYPDLSRSAFVYAVALDEDHPHGFPRPETLPDDRAAAKAAVDQDGAMPGWLAEGVVRALVATYHGTGEPEPANLGGSPFQAGLPGMLGRLGDLLDAAGISVGRPLSELVADIAPDPGFHVPPGFPLPWEVQTSYRFMISFYRLAFWDGFDLDKPATPPFVILPPASDFSDLASLPDLSGPSSGDPVEDVCSAIASFFAWLAHEAEALATLVGDLVEALASPGSYPLRWGLYQVALWAWDMVTTTHEIMAHTGFVLPHGEITRDGELLQPTEIDVNLITLGRTVDAAFLQALSDATDPFGNLDRDPSLVVEPANPRGLHHPLLPVRDAQTTDGEVVEFRRPWAYPLLSRRADGTPYPTPTELSDPRAELDHVGLDGELQGRVLELLGDAAGRALSGPYPTGARPHEVFFRTDRSVDPAARRAYETAAAPAVTDALNEHYIGRAPDTDHSPLGDALPFSAYLLGRVLDPDLEAVVPSFNLDADRGYGYRCWDWVRGQEEGRNGRGQPYPRPTVEPEGSDRWPGAAPDAAQVPVVTRYVDAAPPVLERHGPTLPAPLRRRARRATGEGR